MTENERGDAPVGEAVPPFQGTTPRSEAVPPSAGQTLIAAMEHAEQRATVAREAALIKLVVGFVTHTLGHTEFTVVEDEVTGFIDKFEVVPALLDDGTTVHYSVVPRRGGE